MLTIKTIAVWICVIILLISATQLLLAEPHSQVDQNCGHESYRRESTGGKYCFAGCGTSKIAPDFYSWRADSNGVGDLPARSRKTRWYFIQRNFLPRWMISMATPNQISWCFN